MHPLLEALLAVADGHLGSVDGPVEVGTAVVARVALGNAAPLSAALSWGFVPIGAEKVLGVATN